MFCPNCGHKAEGEEKFCPQCGNPLRGAAGMKKGGSSRSLKLIGIIGGVVLIVIIGALLIGGRESPADVAVAFYKAGNEGSYTKAYGYLTPESRMAWEMLGTFAPRFDNSMDAATKGGTITRIEVREAMEYAGMHATVRLTLDYRNGSRKEDVLTLTKVDGRWRIFTSTLLLTPQFP